MYSSVTWEIEEPQRGRQLKASELVCRVPEAGEISVRNAGGALDSGNYCSARSWTSLHLSRRLS